MSARSGIDTRHATHDGETAEAVSLVSLLGEQRAAIIEQLRSQGECTVADLSEYLGIS